MPEIAALEEITTIVLRAWSGGTFTATTTVYKDKTHTTAFDLTGWTLKLEIEGVKTLEVGKGLTIISLVKGEFTVELTAAETKEFAQRGDKAPHYVLSLEKEGKVLFAAHGPFLIEPA